MLVFLPNMGGGLGGMHSYVENLLGRLNILACMQIVIIVCAKYYVVMVM